MNSGEMKPVRPIPAPRYSLLKKRLQDNSVHQRSNSEPNDYHQYNGNTECHTWPSKESIIRRPSDGCPPIPKPRTIAEKPFTLSDETERKDSEVIKECSETKSISNGSLEPQRVQKKQSIKNRTLSSLLKPSKLLLKRRNSKNKEKFVDSSNSIDCDTSTTVKRTQPVKPTRLPPLPPAKVYNRPPAPLPEDFTGALTDGGEEEEDDDYEDASTLSTDLYQDADDRDLYATIGGEKASGDSESSSDHYEPLSDSDESMKNLGSDEDFYQDVESCTTGNNNDDEVIYEALTNANGERRNSSGQSSQTMTTDSNPPESICKRKLSKPEKKAAKWRKRFNLTGNEIPVNAGLVKEDAKGGGNDLMVKKGEVVLILRMDRNPPGKWLVKNERSKIGYVDLKAIDVDPESIKSIMNISTLYQR